MKNVIVIICLFGIYGCWVAHSTDDKPELQAQIGKTMILSEPALLFKDQGGRIHLAHDEKSYYVRSSKTISTLPAGTELEILDAVYRILPAGRTDYFEIKIHSNNETFEFEVHAEGKYKPKWKDKNSG